MSAPAAPSLVAVNPNETQEQRIARLFNGLEDVLRKDGRFDTVESQLRALAKEVTDLKTVDMKSLVERVEASKAGLELMEKRIRNSKTGFYVPGIESVEFSLSKALVGATLAMNNAGASAKAMFESVDAGAEFEVMKEAEKLKYKIYNPNSFKTAQQVGDDQLGGYWVPDQVLPGVIPAIYTDSTWVALEGATGKTRIQVVGNLFGGEVTMAQNNGGVVAFWVGEEDSIPESALTASEIEMKPRKLGCMVRLTESMKLLAGEGFDSMLKRDMVEAMSKKLDFTIPYGKGPKSPLGIVMDPGIKTFRAQQSGGADISGVVDPATVTDWNTAELEFAGMSKMKLAFRRDLIDIDPNSFAFISSPDFFEKLKFLRAEQYTSQPELTKPFIMGWPFLTEQKLRELIGDYGDSTQIPITNKPGASIGGATTNADAKHTDLFAGNMREILLGRWPGLQITSDDGKGKYFASGGTLMKMTLHADVKVRQPRHIMICPNIKVLP